MQLHGNGPRLRGFAAQAASAVWFHRRRIAAAIVCAVFAAALAAAAPVLVGLALVERHQTRRRRNLLGLVVIAWASHVVAWLWHEVWRHPLEPRGRWHPCRHCGLPISNRSRARYCSPGCRRLALLERRAIEGDQRAQSRLAWLTREDKHDPAWGEVPF
jgi:hypothetical protein